MHNYLRTLKKARLRSNCKIKMSAIAVQSGRILAVAWNTEGSAGNGKYEYSRHAESNLLGKLKQGSTNTIIVWVYREHGGRADTLLLGKPCKRCQRLLVKNNVKSVMFSTEEGWKEERLV